MCAAAARGRRLRVARAQRREQRAVVREAPLEHARRLRGAGAHLEAEHVQLLADALEEGVAAARPRSPRGRRSPRRGRPPGRRASAPAPRGSRSSRVERLVGHAPAPRGGPRRSRSASARRRGRGCCPASERQEEADRPQDRLGVERGDGVPARPAASGPRRGSGRPRIASRTEGRETPSDSARSRSGGSWSPGRSCARHHEVEDAAGHLLGHRLADDGRPSRPLMSAPSPTAARPSRGTSTEAISRSPTTPVWMCPVTLRRPMPLRRREHDQDGEADARSASPSRRRSTRRRAAPW